jgi:O-antigen/teichoic acid export membrane protein
LTAIVSITLAKRGWAVHSALAPAKQEPDAFFRDVAPIGAGILLSALYFRIDIFLLQAWRGTEAVALYNAVFRLIEALRLFPAAVLAVTLPALVRAPTGGTVARVSFGVTGFGAAAGAVLWVSAGWLIPMLYGASYREAAGAFRILAAAFPLMSLNYALTHQLIGWHGHRAYAFICLAALAVNLALNTRLIPALSIDGAAWATLGTEAVVTIGCMAALYARPEGRAYARRARLSGAPVDPTEMS